MWYVGEHSRPAQHASHDTEHTLTWALHTQVYLIRQKITIYSANNILIFHFVDLLLWSWPETDHL